MPSIRSKSAAVPRPSARRRVGSNPAHPVGGRRGRTRLWDEFLASRNPAWRPPGPDDLLGALLAHLLHPVDSMRQQISCGRSWSASPWRLWVIFAAIAIVGSLLYGATLALVLPVRGWGYASLALTASAGVGWVLFGPVLAGVSAKPANHLAHASLVAMLLGEAVLELGVLANISIALFFPMAPAPVLAINLVIVAAANLAMLVVLCAQLRLLDVRPTAIAALWFLILNPAGLACFRLFYPDLLPF